MNINDAYPSKYIKADDLAGHRIGVTVMAVTMEDIGDKEFKPIMRFMGKDKGLVLNKTNSQICAGVWGAETDAWQGQKLELYAQPVMFQGRQVMGLAVAPMLAAGQSMAQAAPGPLGATRAEQLAQVYDDQAHMRKPGPHDHPAAVPAQHPIPDSVVRDGGAGVAPQQQAVADAVDAGAAKNALAEQHAVDPAGNLDDLPF